MLDLAHPPRDVIFHYIEQDSNGKYGTAIPVALVYPHLKKDESIAVLMGDDFVYNRDNSSELARLIATTPEGGNSMLTATNNNSDLSRYGVVDFNEETGAFDRIIEHPPVGQAPSNQINISKYVFNYEMMTRIYNYCQLDISGEYFIIDPISQAVLDNIITTVVPAQGEYLDCGNVHGWLYANKLIVEHQ
jgi:UTP-glucose-1-phosphate uridylyltransferase